MCVRERKLLLLYRVLYTHIWLTDCFECVKEKGDLMMVKSNETKASKALVCCGWLGLCVRVVNLSNKVVGFVKESQLPRIKAFIPVLS